MIHNYQIKKYFWSLFSIIGVVLFWAGIWDGLGNLAYLANPLISFFVGLLILMIAAFFFRGYELFGGAVGKKTIKLHQLNAHPKKHLFTVKYYDKIKKRNKTIDAKDIQEIENDTYLVLKSTGKELFIPIHRVKEVYFKGKPWKIKK